MFVWCCDTTSENASIAGNEEEINNASENETSSTPLNCTSRTSIQSSITEINYPISVALPADYDENDPNGYEVVYALDGQWSFENYSRIISNSGKELILVSIHQGQDNRRATDYLLPGAIEYFKFLELELIPYVECYYNASSMNRSLIGESAGGILVNVVLLLDNIENPVFSNLLSMDAPFSSLHQGQTRTLEEERYLLNPKMEVNFVLTGALLPGSIGPFDSQVESFYELLLDRNYEGLQLTKSSYNVDHFGIGSPSFEQALTKFYEL